jgi:hypothetical protein
MLEDQVSDGGANSASRNEHRCPDVTFHTMESCLLFLCSISDPL